MKHKPEKRKKFILSYRNLNPYQKFKRSLHLTIFSILFVFVLLILDSPDYFRVLIYCVLATIICLLQTIRDYLNWKAE